MKVSRRIRIDHYMDGSAQDLINYLQELESIHGSGQIEREVVVVWGETEMNTHFVYTSEETEEERKRGLTTEREREAAIEAREREQYETLRRKFEASGPGVVP